MARNNNNRGFKDGDRNEHGLHYHAFNPEEESNVNICTFSGNDSLVAIKNELREWKARDVQYTPKLYQIFLSCGPAVGTYEQLRDIYNCL